MTAGTVLTLAPKAEAGIKIRATVCPDKDVCITVGDRDDYYYKGRRYRKGRYYRDYDDDYYYRRRRNRRYYPAGYYWHNGHQYHRDSYGNVRLIRW